MPITFKDIEEHKEFFNITNLDARNNEDYKKIIENKAFFYLDHHALVRHNLSGDILATNKKQLDMLIEELNSYREQLPD